MYDLCSNSKQLTLSEKYCYHAAIEIISNIITSEVQNMRVDLENSIPSRILYNMLFLTYGDKLECFRCLNG